LGAHKSKEWRPFIINEHEYVGILWMVSTLIVWISERNDENPFIYGQRNKNFSWYIYTWYIYINLVEEQGHHLYLCRKDKYTSLCRKITFSNRQNLNIQLILKDFFTNPQVINLRLRRLMIEPPTRRRLIGLSRPIIWARGLLQAHNFFYQPQMPNFESPISRAQLWRPNLDVFNTLPQH
jgi:hypothetical protein